MSAVPELVHRSQSADSPSAGSFKADSCKADSPTTDALSSSARRPDSLRPDGPETAGDAAARPAETHGQAPHAPAHRWQLPLTAEERTRLRGRRLSRCGHPMLLLLPRGEPLQPGEWLTTAHGDVWVQVEAAPEQLLQVRAADPLALLQAAYHLGNRHVALELQPGSLRLLADPVLENLLRQRGLTVEMLEAPFHPEAGAYGGHGPGSHHHHHSTAHSHPDHGDTAHSHREHSHPEHNADSSGHHATSHGATAALINAEHPTPTSSSEAPPAAPLGAGPTGA